MLPWPGKCLAVARMPFAWYVSTMAVPNRATSSGDAPNDRMPMTGLSGLSLTSITGARFMLIPTARISAAMTAAISRARSADPVAPTAMLLGKTVKPSVRRLTGPPSWSIATNSGMPAPSRAARLCASPIRRANCSGLSMFPDLAKSTMPPMW